MQRASEPVRVDCYDNDDEYAAALREAVAHAKDNDGLTAIVVPWKHEAKRLRAFLGDAADGLVDMEAAAELPTNGAMIITLQLAKGLEFDHVIVPDASARVFPADDRVAKNRLYTTVSRATRSVQILCRGELTPLLKKYVRSIREGPDGRQADERSSGARRRVLRYVRRSTSPKCAARLSRNVSR